MPQHCSRHILWKLWYENIDNARFFIRFDCSRTRISIEFTSVGVESGTLTNTYRLNDVYLFANWGVWICFCKSRQATLLYLLTNIFELWIVKRTVTSEDTNHTILNWVQWSRLQSVRDGFSSADQFGITNIHGDYELGQWAWAWTFPSCVEQRYMRMKIIAFCANTLKNEGQKQRSELT